ncbi:ferritin-like domain-containing protein [Streptomyces sp. NPDC092129]|uniref:ferritin-like domain-containing protein n=1 Tax=Streptomyces sp. NPDC092129 TaxID=3366010 RepID=UPI0038018653
MAKQAHWNVYGPRFRSVHLQLDEVVATTRGYADRIAERAAGNQRKPTAGRRALPKQADFRRSPEDGSRTPMSLGLWWMPAMC